MPNFMFVHLIEMGITDTFRQAAISYQPQCRKVSVCGAQEVESAPFRRHNRGVAKRRIYDSEQHAQFVTFGCYRRRRLLDHPRMRDALVAILADKLQTYHGLCSGFVIMPEHVHAIVWFRKTGELSRFMKSWKQTSSLKLKSMLRGLLPNYARLCASSDPFWQPKYYPFNLYSARKAREKLDYMHLNPVAAGLVRLAVDWKWSSARYYEWGEPVGVPLRWIF
jgi:putative transposase